MLCIAKGKRFYVKKSVSSKNSQKQPCQDHAKLAGEEKVTDYFSKYQVARKLNEGAAHLSTIVFTLVKISPNLRCSGKFYKCEI